MGMPIVLVVYIFALSYSSIKMYIECYIECIML